MAKIEEKKVPATTSKNVVGAEAALEILKEGNHRFVQGLRSVESMIRSRDLAELAERGQSPFAIVLACADSRVPIEILFDRGPGDIIVCRVAGNVATQAIMGTMEFATEQFHSGLLVVMGHTRCGAIEAALNRIEKPEKTSENLQMIVDQLQPAAREAWDRCGGVTRECVDSASSINVRHTMHEILERSPVLAGRIADGRLTMVGAMCNIDTGEVRFD